MPDLIQGTASWNDLIPTAADGDLADSASIDQSVQQLANNARWLYEMCTSGGVLAIRRVADVTALKGVKDMIDGQVAYVAGRGVYLYVDPAPVAGEELPWIVAPSLGSGRWVHPLNAIRNVAQGVAALDDKGRVAASVIPFGLVQPPIYKEPGGYLAQPNAAWQDVPTASVSIAGVQAGDILELSAQVDASADSKDDQIVFVRFMVGATPTKPTRFRFLSSAAASIANIASLALVANYVCTGADVAAGTLAVTVQANATGLIHGSVNVNAIRVHHVRP